MTTLASPAVDKVVIVVFDGLRPDMIVGRMPFLESFAKRATWFREARSVFPSVTRVATTSFATGSWPGAHGILNNAFHQSQVRTDRAIDTGNPDDLRLAEERLGGLVTATSLGQTLASAGRRMGAVHCGTGGAAWLVNHCVAANGHWTFSVHGEEATQTPKAVRQATDLLGPLPGKEIPKFEVLRYAQRVMEQIALGPDQPDVSLVWLPEPDTSFHYREIGSDPTREVMAAADAVFAGIVAEVERGPHAERTAIIAMSDHGQITITGAVDLPALLSDAGLRAASAPAPGVDLLYTGGNSGELRLIDPDPRLAARAAGALMERDEIGMVFVRDDLVSGIPGALPLSLVHHTHARSPELFYVMRSDERPDHRGIPGRTVCSGGPPVGGGMHGGLNRYEMNTVLMISAPGMERGLVTSSPCGLIDIAPTVLDLLGEEQSTMQGRSLRCDLAPGTTEEHSAAHGGFAQVLERRSIAGRSYLQQGGRA
ncbi:alkaline phosphatase family protein [uncultured Thioclava sp.]|uniref:alkaline phosphatase family protein n=1 Tax=uncultured Thioclava sp. TaxID=473858 RepID=UPI0025FE14EA|nr:alkaline phosphatase family protein [uncultured Thioclava sp.]